ncbi:MAG: GNAT family N-acetyltransferase, partial [Parasporobacterium sp.]|nr:GNAT family N-acetyltransferase [Parasporobacterium sp.]
MKIRRAEKKDIKGLIKLLQQVLELHAAIRPDIFISGTTKYTEEELQEMVCDEQNPIYVAVDETEQVIAYAFCQLRKPPFTNTMIPHQTLFIDDFCVDENARGNHVGSQLFEYVKQEAKRFDCYEVMLAVWRGNDGAEQFYERGGCRP